MKKIPFILTLLLITAWGYTSWYWYTCNIQGLCDRDGIVKTQQEPEIFLVEQKQSTTSISDITENSLEIDTNTGGEASSPKLSADDVLGESFIPKEIISTSSGSVIESLSGTIDLQKDSRIGEESSSGTLLSEQEDNLLQTESLSLCSSPLVGPLSIAGDNPQGEMEKLEEFLKQKGYISVVDGVFGKTDLGAVKKLQLEYKKEMLDPWGISQPTGYVGKTTVATINDIACLTN